MIIEASEDLRRRGATIEKQIKDDQGIIAILLTFDSNFYCLVAKEYAYEGKASFIKQVAETAHRQNTDLIFYNNDDGSYTVFDPDMVNKFADDSVGDSKKASAEWREIDLEYGIELERHLEGAEFSLPGGQEQLVKF